MGNISINLLFTGMTGTCEPLVMQFEFQSYMRTFFFPESIWIAPEQYVSIEEQKEQEEKEKAEEVRTK